MAYPDELMYDYYAIDLSDKIGLETLGQPMFDICDDAAQTTGYRFASNPRGGTLYVKFDRDEV